MSDDKVVPIKRGGRTSTTRQKGDGHKASGAGWGGPAKGAGSGAPVGPKPENMLGAHGAGPTVEVRAKKEVRDMAKAERLDALNENLVNLALNAENETTQLNATVAALNRLEGMPVQRSITGTLDDLDRMTDGELVAELTRASKILALGGEGADPSPLPRKPTDLVQ